MAGLRSLTSLVAAVAALIVAVPVQAAPTVPASPGLNCSAGYMSDQTSGNCWQMASGGAPSVGGVPCMPGRVGLCLGYLQYNAYAPDDALPDTDSWS